MDLNIHYLSLLTNPSKSVTTLLLHSPNCEFIFISNNLKKESFGNLARKQIDNELDFSIFFYYYLLVSDNRFGRYNIERLLLVQEDQEGRTSGGQMWRTLSSMSTKMRRDLRDCKIELKKLETLFL